MLKYTHTGVSLWILTSCHPHWVILELTQTGEKQMKRRSHHSTSHHVGTVLR